MRQTLLLLPLFYFSFIVNAKSQPPSDSLQAVQKGNALLKQVEQVFQKDLDSAAVLLKKATPYFIQAKSWQKYINCLNATATVQYYRKDYDQYYQNAQAAVTESKKHFSPQDPLYGEALNNLGAYFYNLGNYDKTIAILKQVLEIKINSNEAGVELAFVHQNLGKNYNNKGEYLKALQQHRKALTFRRDSLPPGDYLIANSLRDIGHVFKNNKQVDSAFTYYNESLQMLGQLSIEKPIVHRRTISTHLDLAEVWLAKKQHAKAIQQIERALALQTAPYAWQKPKSWQLLGKVNADMGQYNLSIQQLKKAVELASDPASKTLGPALAKILHNLGDTYTAQQQFNSALVQYDQALSLLGMKEAEASVTQLLDKPQALKILNAKANSLWQWHQKTKDAKHLQASYSTYLSTTQLVRDIRQGFLTVEAKNALAGSSVAIYEGAIRTAGALYKLEGDQNYLHQAFQLAESNKALLLLEQVNEQAARGFVQLPDSLLQQEKDLKIKLAFYQKKLLETQLKSGTGEATIQKFSSAIIDIKEALSDLSDRFAAHSPLYHQLKFDTQPISISSIQTQIRQADQILLEYFVGDSSVFIFKITAEAIVMKEVEAAHQLTPAIEAFRANLIAPAQRQILASDFTRFCQLSSDLHQQLLAPVLSNEAAANSLLIIPDHQLNYLPFELLIPHSDTSNKVDFAELNYLIKKFAVSYDYSATLFYRKKGAEQEGSLANSFVGFAPDFGEGIAEQTRTCNANQLSPLKCNREEVNRIAELLHGKALLGIEASTSNFQQQVSNSHILHLATHACIDESNPLYNKIYLTDDFLSGIEFNQLTLKADLAVLSACNTGSGKLIKGEGVMSLARSFMTAGCKSTVMSMWAVNDCATSELMYQFYQQLTEGASKNEALRMAKLAYLNTADKASAHPYYWGAFVQFGDTSSITFSKSIPYSLIIGLGILFLLLFLFFKKRSDAKMN